MSTDSNKSPQNQPNQPTPLSPEQVATEQAKQAAKVTVESTLLQSNTQLDQLLAEKAKEIELLKAGNKELQSMLDGVNKTVTMLKGEAKDLQAALNEARAEQVVPAAPVTDDATKALMLKGGRYDRDITAKDAEILKLRDDLRKARDNARRDSEPVLKAVQDKLTAAQGEIDDLQIKLIAAINRVKRIEAGGDSEFEIKSKIVNIVNDDTSEVDRLRNEGWEVVFETIYLHGTGGDIAHVVRVEKRTARAEVAPEPAAAEAVVKAESHLATLIADVQSLNGLNQPQPTAEITVLDEPQVFTKSPFAKGYEHDAGKRVESAA